MKDSKPILFVFVDGLGLGTEDPLRNPLANRERFPVLAELLKKSVPLDPSMGVAGLPQSATGQAALLTGLNAAQRMGRHIEGFPPPRLKEVVAEHNLFSTLSAMGKTCTFANAYWLDDVSQIPPRRESVTTVATLSALGSVRGKEMLLDNRAVYHDLTREKLVGRGYDGPLISPEEAAQHLTEIAQGYDFTLFEFFETDHAGHGGALDEVLGCLDKLERFFAVVLEFDGVLIVTSDHGNIEDLSVQTHTKNPVPLFISDAGRMAGIERIEDLVPAILSWSESE